MIGKQTVAHHLSSDVAKHLKYWVPGTFGKIGSYVTKVNSPFKNKTYSIYNRNSLVFFQVKNFMHPEGPNNFFLGMLCLIFCLIDEL